MDAESTCSGNPHVTSPPGLFPRHPPLEGLLKPAFISQRQDEEPPNIWDTSGISGNVFCKSTSFFVSSVSSRSQATNNIVMWEIPQSNADWDCFKILTSREILKIQNPLLGEHCAFLEVIHLFQ